LPEHQPTEINPPETNASDRPAGDPVRRQRYARSSPPAACLSLTPTRVEILCYLAELRFLSLPQIARLCCPSGRRDLAEKSARRHMRALFDGGLVDVLPVSRAALAPPGTPNDASLLYGSAPNVYALAARGLEMLYRAGLTDKPDAMRKKPAYGPRNSLFLAHELAVRDVRVWLQEGARSSRDDHEVLHWADGAQAAIGLPSRSRLLPDAWFVYQVEKGEPPTVLVAFVEVDRGTERGERRWDEKLAAYASLLADREALTAATGYLNARVLVLTPDARRRDELALLLVRCARRRDLAPQVLDRFWLAGDVAQAQMDFTAAVWRRPGGVLWPLTPVRRSVG